MPAASRPATDLLFPRFPATLAAMNADGSTVDWFHAGVIAPPGYDPPGFDSTVGRTLAKLLGPKSLTHKIGIHFPWAEPICHPITAGAAENRWHAAGFAIDRMSREAGWIRCWLQIAAASQAIVVFGPPTPAMEVVLELCGRIGCRVRLVDPQVSIRPDGSRQR